MRCSPSFFGDAHGVKEFVRLFACLPTAGKFPIVRDSAILRQFFVDASSDDPARSTHDGQRERIGMERRAASHTEEEEMNQRRKLLNAARRGDPKAISKLFELYQVRVLSGDQLAKVNRSSTYMVPAKPSKEGKSVRKVSAKRGKSVPSKRVKVRRTSPVKTASRPSARKPARGKTGGKRKAKHK